MAGAGETSKNKSSSAVRLKLYTLSSRAEVEGPLILRDALALHGYKAYCKDQILSYLWPLTFLLSLLKKAVITVPRGISNPFIP